MASFFRSFQKKSSESEKPKSSKDVSQLSHQQFEDKIWSEDDLFSGLNVLSTSDVATGKLVYSNTSALMDLQDIQINRSPNESPESDVQEQSAFSFLDKDGSENESKSDEDVIESPTINVVTPTTIKDFVEPTTIKDVLEPAIINKDVVETTITKEMVELVTIQDVPESAIIHNDVVESAITKDLVELVTIQDVLEPAIVQDVIESSVLNEDLAESSMIKDSKNKKEMLPNQEKEHGNADPKIIYPKESVITLNSKDIVKLNVDHNVDVISADTLKENPKSINKRKSTKKNKTNRSNRPGFQNIKQSVPMKTVTDKLDDKDKETVKDEIDTTVDTIKDEMKIDAINKVITTEKDLTQIDFKEDFSNDSIQQTVKDHTSNLKNPNVKADSSRSLNDIVIDKELHVIQKELHGNLAAATNINTDDEVIIEHNTKHLEDQTKHLEDKTKPLENQTKHLEDHTKHLEDLSNKNFEDQTKHLEDLSNEFFEEKNTKEGDNSLSFKDPIVYDKVDDIIAGPPLDSENSLLAIHNAGPKDAVCNNFSTADITWSLDKFYADVENCYEVQAKFKISYENFVKSQTNVIKQWQADQLSEEELNKEITLLEAHQTKLELNEEYNKASEIDQQILCLQEKYENSCFQHLLAYDKIDNFILTYEDYVTSQQKEKGDLINKLNTIKIKSDPKIYGDRLVKTLSEDLLKIKEKKLEVERSLSHVELDLEHNIKNYKTLQEDVASKTEHLYLEKEEIIEKKSVITLQIIEVKKKLAELEQEESSYTNQIDEIDVKVNAIIKEFQPTTSVLEIDQMKFVKQQTELQNNMSELTEKEHSILLEKENLNQQREKYNSTIQTIETELTSLNKQLQEYNEIQKLEQIIDLNLLKISPDEVLIKKRTDLKSSNEKIKQHSIQISEGDNQMKALQRSLESIETQLADLQKIKKQAAKDRNYQEAQRMSDIIITLTREGESTQMTVLQLSDQLNMLKTDMKNLQCKITEDEIVINTMQKELDMKMLENVQKVVIDLESFLASNPEHLMKNLLQVELNHCKEIIVKQKGRLNVIPKVKDDMQLHADIQSLEEKLAVAENIEDWALAESINEKIIKTKAKLNR